MYKLYFHQKTLTTSSVGLFFFRLSCRCSQFDCRLYLCLVLNIVPLPYKTPNVCVKTEIIPHFTCAFTKLWSYLHIIILDRIQWNCSKVCRSLNCKPFKIPTKYGIMFADLIWSRQPTSSQILQSDFR